jgi:CheY-like chemotaxis protein
MRQSILIIDDDPDVVLYLSTLLEDHGYKALSASDGMEGFDRAGKEHPDLILLDLMMPAKSGISLLADLKKDEDLRKIPVIMVTGVSGETGIGIQSFLQALIDDGVCENPEPAGYLEKPVRPERLLGLVKDVLRGGK